MKIPTIHGRHKIRDFSICRDYIVKHKSISTIAEENKISGTRVYRILYNNREYLKLDKEFEKAKRIFKLKKLAQHKTESKKDITDILEQLRKEIEGDKPLINVDNSKHIYSSVKVVIDDKSRISSPPRTRTSIPEQDAV